MGTTRNEENSKRIHRSVLSFPSRYALCALILFLLLIALYILTLRLIAETHVHRAGNLFREGHYGLALVHLEKAVHCRPGDYTIQKEMGKTYSKLAGLQPGAEKGVFLMRTAQERYLEAFRLNPLDAEVAYALARGEEGLQQLDNRLHPEKKHTEYNALPYFREAIRLRPNGITYRYALARYLHRRGEQESLVSAVHTLARIYPPSCRHLKREPFWSPAIAEACKGGLREAIDGKTSLREAHRIMAYILAEEKEWEGAITHYREAVRGVYNSAGDYMQLGLLYLQNGQLEEAEDNLLKCLNISRTRDQDLERLYGIYTRRGYYNEFSGLSRKVRDRFAGSSKTEMIFARSLINLKQYNRARRILDEINRKEPTAEAWYWLARVAEAEQDWDRMELAIQKATVLDPSNGGYHLLFSQVLKRRNKLERAEGEASRAISHQGKPSPSLFDHRARIRWSMQDYPGALRDWRSAIALKPDSASFYAQAAEACVRMGNSAGAVEYYQKAVKLEPGNERYGKRYKELKAGG